ncbi:hypothetical protein ABFU38_21340 [Xanthomonas campestris pv. raphani]|uniref:hypothetical protein n=1 Tax=Xanthomonas campestris TaxID=339 RepID=UPI00388E7677
MEEPIDFLFFRIKREGIGHHQFVYSPASTLVTEKLNNIVVAVNKGPLLPDSIVIICPDATPDDTLKELRSSRHETVKERLSDRVPLLYVPLDVVKSLTGEPSLVFDSLIPSDLHTLIVDHSWIQEGLSKIFDEYTVVHRAPPGYAFHKPSGGSSSFFLKPDLALSTLASISFVAIAALRRIFPSGLSKANEIKNIYVDTMAIAPVAFSIKEFIERSSVESTISINSFHSYGGMDEIGNPVAECNICIISASSSMSLHDKWIREKSAHSNYVVTLLTIREAYKADRALHVLNLRESISEGPAELSIRIHGESFISASEVPKRVLLRKEAHKIEKEVKPIFSLRDEGVLDAYSLDRASRGHPRAIYANGSRLINARSFQEWLDKTVPQLLRANCRHIIHQEDIASAELATDLAIRCEKLSGIRPNCIPESSIADVEIIKTSALIVCAAVVGKGSALLQISRALRDLHDGPRLYLLGLQISETREEVETFVNNIKFRNIYPYDVATYGTLSVGTQLVQSFKQELNFYEKVENQVVEEIDSIKERLKFLGTSSYTGNKCLLNFGAKADKTMKLRKGFVFWPPSYTSGAYQAEVIATIAIILQRAREDTTLSDANSLRSRTFRHVMIDPENFSRYNDGIIQAAILRCAFPSELDFRGSSSSSSFMKMLISRILMKMDREEGEAALEFLLAIHSNRLKLIDTDLEDLREMLTQVPVAENVRRFLEYLLGRSNTEDDIAAQF